MNFIVYDLQQRFTLRQAATLWCEVETLDDNNLAMVNTVLQTLLLAAEANRLRVHRGAAMTVSRVDLASWVAATCEVLKIPRPKFLFPEERQLPQPSVISLWSAALAVSGIHQDFIPSTRRPGDPDPERVRDIFEALKRDVETGTLPAIKPTEECDHEPGPSIVIIGDPANRWMVSVPDLIHWTRARDRWIEELVATGSEPEMPVPDDGAVPSTFSRQAIRANFVLYTNENWASFFNHEKRNGLFQTRVRGHGKVALYDRRRFATWLVNRGAYSIAAVNAILDGQRLTSGVAPLSEEHRPRLVKGWATR